MNYATFWQRFAAIWIDLLVLAPIIFLQTWIESKSKAAAIVLIIPMSAAYCGYTIYCHARYGQTVGKHAMGIRVIRTNGDRISWREAGLRSSVDIVFAVLSTVSIFIAFAAISDAAYYGVGWVQRGENLEALSPAWLNWSSLASQIWFWSEVIVMLFNKRRRALHDFIAGTIVTSERKESVPQIQPA